MKKLAFVGNGESPEYLLNLFKKMTPGNSGEWGQLKGINNYKDADYFMVIDWLPPGLGIDPKKCVFLSGHPETMQAYRDMSSYQCLAKADAKETFGFLEFWIKYDYDYLANLKPMEKTKTLCAVVSNARTQSYHTKRIDWLHRFCASNPKEFDLHGRIVPDSAMKPFYRGACGDADGRGFAASGKDHMIGKEQVLEEHKYIAEFDATGANYWSERVADAMLLWCMPLYWGGSGVHKCLPENSFRYIDINGNGEDVKEIIKSGFYEKHMEDLAKARDLILNKYQLWARTHEFIFGVAK